MKRWQLLALLLGALLITAPLCKVHGQDEDEEGDDEYEEYEGEDGEDGAVGEDEEDKDVVVLTSENFDDTVLKAEFALVEFYAPWCGHCKRLKPEYAGAASELKAYNADIVVGKVDATEEKELAEKYEVQGYPTIKWIVNGKASDYGGGRDTDSIVRWVKKKTGPPAITVDTEEELEAAEDDNEVVLLGYFAKFEGKEYDAFIAAARLAEDVVFAQTKEATIAKAAGAKGDAPALVIIKNFDDEDREVMVFEGEITADRLEEFVMSEKLPLVIPFVDKNQDKIFDSGIDRQCLVVAKTEDLTASSELLKAVKAVAALHKGKVIFVSVDAAGDSAESVINFFGLDKEKLPQVVAFQLSGSKKYKMEAQVTEESLKAFVSGVVDGTVEPDYKSEDIPEDDMEDGVQIVVGKTFDKIVCDPEKDVILEVYAPWCGHCKALAPIYAKLAKRFAKIDSVVVAKMDGTANEHREVEVEGFPTILFFPAKEGCEPIPYESGDRTLLGLTKFIKQVAVKEYKLPTKAKKGADDSDTKKGGAEEDADHTEL